MGGRFVQSSRSVVFTVGPDGIPRDTAVGVATSAAAKGLTMLGIGPSIVRPSLDNGDVLDQLSSDFLNGLGSPANVTEGGALYADNGEPTTASFVLVVGTPVFGETSVLFVVKLLR